MKQLNISGLFPNFSKLSLYPESAEQLSALFVAILIGVAALFLVVSLWALIKACLRTRWIWDLLKKETSQTVVMNRQELRDKASNARYGAGHIWNEFDETLIEALLGEEIHLHNIYDANHFFNSTTLAREITESRMLAAVPGFLTALGVIGTFVGLQLGLSELNIGNDASVQDMKAGLAHVISGAKIAFMTSVWGVTLSVLFNFIEKLLEGYARSRIHRLQDRIDELFPRFSAEVQLKKIAEDGNESREALQGMAERIGEKMQESLLEATTGIQQGLEASLEKIMAPAINKLVNETTDGSQKALEQLVECFLDKFGEQGETQRKAMDDASKGVSDTLSSMNGALEGFIGNLQQSQNAAAQREQQLIAHISDQVDELAARNSKHGEFLAEITKKQIVDLSETFNQSQQAQEQREVQLLQQFESSVAGMGTLMEQHHNANAEREQQLIEHISSQVDELVEKNSRHGKLLADITKQQIEGISETLEKSRQAQEQREAQLEQRFEGVVAGMGESIDRQTMASNSLMQQGKVLQQQVTASQASLESLAKAIEHGASELRSAVKLLKEYGEGVNRSSRELSGVIQDAANSTADLANENRKSALAAGQVHQKMSQDIATLGQVIEKLDAVVQLADSTFAHLEEHQRSYLVALKENVGELAEQASQLLKDYAEQANAQTAEHLNLWAQHTTDYAEQMNEAARALSAVVDEIEDKLGR